MRSIFTCLALLTIWGCSSPPPVTSNTLSDKEIQSIYQRVENTYPDISADKEREVVKLAVRALENMVYVEGGTFQMGDWVIECQWDKSQGCRMDMDTSNDHVHEVKLSSFSISKYETTMGDFDLYRELQGKEPYREDWRESEELADLFHPRKPAWTKDWQETQDYCQWVGEFAGVEMDLPTEAQWEYAARSRGRWLIWATDNGEIDPGRNFPKDGDGFGETQKVGSYPPNPLGIYDMAANSKEWVSDWYSETYYSESPIKDPTGPSSADKKVLRGGFNGVSPDSSFTVSRTALPPNQKEYTRLLGFRCTTRAPK